MGIALSFIPFFDECHRQGGLLSPCFALGSQEIHEAADTIRRWAHQEHHVNLVRTLKVCDLLRDRYGIESYVDCDVNGLAAFRFDLNRSLPTERVFSAMTVLDAGTLEHVFDVAQVFRNIFSVLCPGGTAIHIAPMTWHEHGFYNFNPLLFRYLIGVNECSLLTEAVHFPSDPKTGKDESTLIFTSDNHSSIATESFARKFFQGTSHPAGVLYMVAYRRGNCAPFKLPYQIQD